MVSEHQVQQRKITVSVSDLLLVFGCTGSEVSGSVQHLELFEEVKGYLSGCSALAEDKVLSHGPAQGKFEVEKFDGQGDFGLWKFKMLMQLELQGLDFVLGEEESSNSVKGKEKEGDVTESTSSPVDPLKKEKDKRANNLICSSLSNMILQKVMKETTALGVWKALERDYQTKSLPNQIYLKQRFASFKMEEHKSI